MYSELTSSIASNLDGVGTAMQGVLAEVAPTAITVMGAYLVVKGAIRFFKGVAKG